MSKGKPFKETKLGKFLSEKVPDVADMVGDVLPDKGVLGIIKNVISRREDIAPEDQMEIQRLIDEHEKEMFSLEVQDRSSARQREVDFVKIVGHSDRFQYFIGAMAVITACSVIYFLLYLEIPEKNEHVVMLFIGELLGIVTSIFTYYFGSSMGSRIKDMRSTK